MKLKIILVALSISFFSCKKDKEATPVEPIGSTTPIKYSGDFIDGPNGTVEGIAKIYKNINGKYALKLENFRSSNGPNLHVYLSKEEFPVNYLDLGKLRSLKGDQVYEISENMDDKPYTYVCIFCVDFKHLFGSTKF